MKIAHAEVEKNLKNAAKENQISSLYSNCNGKIKNAHVLQNNKIISLLAGTERHVYTMDKK